ncbi:MAG: reverse transcriptase family protein [Waddliaceae bacterium]
MKYSQLPEILKPKRLAYVLHLEYDLLLYLAKNVEQYYYEKPELKLNNDGTPKLRNGVPQYRILTPSKGLLKTTQKMIKNRIVRKFDFPIHMQGGVRRRSNITNAKIHQGRKYHFCTDIRDFFPTISSRTIYEVFSRHYPPNVSRLLTILTTYKGELPQGTPTSTYLANMAFLPVAQSLVQLCKHKGIFFSTFIDDLSFSSPSDFKEITFQIIDIIQENGFRINHRKTLYKVGPTEITGIWAKNNNLDARDDQKQKLDDPNLTPMQRQGLQAYVDNVMNA